MERWINKVAVVTGSSSGIGAAVVRDLLKAGVIVVGLARRIDRTRQLAKEVPKAYQNNLHAVQCDITDSDSVQKAFNWIIGNLGGVDILINNAGYLTNGLLLEMDLGKVQQVIQTNIMGIVYCTQLAFKSMKERNVEGHVVLMNSIAGHQVFCGLPGTKPDFNIYSPSKHAVTAMTEIYRQEFNYTGAKVKITSVNPGAVDTEMVPDDVRKHIETCILKAEDVSQCVMFALATPPHVQIHDITVKPMGEVL